ncbi:MAG: peptide ABC transporter substrate-binding protein [Chloroflexota bacterium]
MIIIKKFPQFITLLLIAFIISCNQETSTATPVVVTQVVEVAQTPIVITRIVEQVITPSPPPPQTNDEQRLPISLDISIVGSQLPSFNPQVSQSASDLDVVENLFVGLTRFNPITQQVEPALAESWEVTENGKVWTFNLRDDIFWTKPVDQGDDGFWTVEAVSAVDANDVVYTVQQACQRDTALPDVVILFIIEGCEPVFGVSAPTQADISEIGVTALDERTVKFTLTRPASYFLTISSLWYLRPLPKTIIEEFEEDWLSPDNFVSSGPFFPVPNRPTFQKNPLWPIESVGNVDIVNFILVSESENAFQLWDAKRIDYIQFSDSFTAVGVASNSEERMTGPEQTLFYLGFNFQSGVFREPEVRRAFSAAIDRQLLIDELYSGNAFIMNHLVPPGVVGAQPIDEIGMGYDPDYARQQLAESGFRSCRGIPEIRFLVNSSDLSLLQAELIREMWINELGCAEEQIIIDQVQFGTLLANTRQDASSFRPDVWELGWASFYPDAHSWMGELIHCSESENRADRTCVDVDDVIRNASTIADQAERAALYREIEMQLFSRGGIAPIVPLYAPAQNILTQTWLQMRPTNFGGQQYDRIVIDGTLKRLEQSR